MNNEIPRIVLTHSAIVLIRREVGMEFYIVQLDFSAAFDTVSQSGLLFQLKSIGEGGSVLWRVGESCC